MRAEHECDVTMAVMDKICHYWSQRDLDSSLAPLSASALEAVW